MRLEPIDKPKGLTMRFAFWMTRRQLGKVITPMKVLYPRMSGMLRPYNLINLPLEIESDGLWAIAQVRMG